MKRLLIAGACALAMLGSAHAQQFQSSNAYGELGYTFLNVGDASPGAIRAMLGYDFHPYFGAEGMLAFGVNDDHSTVFVGATPVDVKVKLDAMYGIYLKPKYNFNQLEVFGRLGWAHVKIKADATAGGAVASGSGSDSDFSYGLGLNYNLNPKMRVGLDYMVYNGSGSDKIDGWTISFGYRF
jgi:opacity protein-like surface antigen